MNTLRRQSNRFCRRAAGLLAFLCLWMGTAGLLHHTHEDQIAQSSSPVASLGHRTVAAPAPDMCAACEWTQMLQTSLSAVSPLPQPFARTRPRSVSIAFLCLSQTFVYSSPRAPPAFL